MDWISEIRSLELWVSIPSCIDSTLMREIRPSWDYFNYTCWEYFKSSFLEPNDDALRLLFTYEAVLKCVPGSDSCLFRPWWAAHLPLSFQTHRLSLLPPLLKIPCVPVCLISWGTKFKGDHHHHTLLLQACIWKFISLPFSSILSSCHCNEIAGHSTWSTDTIFGPGRSMPFIYW